MLLTITSELRFNGVDYKIEPEVFMTPSTFTPKDIGLEDEGRWIGSIVRLKREVRDIMGETKMSASALSYPVNPAAQQGRLPGILLLSTQPPLDVEYVVTGVTFQRAADAYNRHFQQRDLTGNVCVFQLSAKLQAPQARDFVPETWRDLNVPVRCLELVSLAKASDPLPEVGIDYAVLPWDLSMHRFEKLDKSVDGFCNKPTAVLAVSVRSTAELNRKVERIRTSSGLVTEKGLARLSKSNKWEHEFIQEDDYYIEGFPMHRMSVNYKEIADWFNQK